MGVYDDERPFDYPGSSQGEPFDEDKPLTEEEKAEAAELASYIERELEDEDKPWAREA